MADSKSRNRAAMTLTGSLLLVASVLYLFFVEDPFPMWLIIGGAGVMFIGAAASFQRRSQGTRP